MKKILIILLFPFCFLGQTVLNVGNTTVNFGLYPKNPNSAYTISDVGHYYISTAMTIGFGLLAYKTILKKNENRKGLSCLVGAGGSLLIGIVGKELIHDKWMGKGVPSFKDGALDVFGTCAGALGLRVGFEMHELRQDKKEAEIEKVKRLNHDKNFNW